jgi:diacylglycerol kinase
VTEPLPPYQRPPRSLLVQWGVKFRDAASGVVDGCRTQESLWVHVAVMLAVIALAAVLRVESWRWAVLILCIAAVVASELFNTAIEQLVRILHPAEHRSIALVLHLAAGGVLVTAVGAVIVGLVVLAPPLLVLLGLIAE